MNGKLCEYCGRILPKGPFRKYHLECRKKVDREREKLYVRKARRNYRHRRKTGSTYEAMVKSYNRGPTKEI